MNPYIGRQLGTYRLIRELGSGGFADVYLGKHVQTNWDVAVKILKIHYPEATFRQEAEILWKLNHPHIVKIMHYNTENGISYLVMEYADKGSLRNIHRLGDVLPQPLILEYVKQIADALDYMHKQHLVHCDIKPQNFLARANNELVLSDFGIATEAMTTSLRLASLPSAQKPLVGTLHYIAPEQWDGRNPTSATDQYALGVVVYEWLCGRRPFVGSNIQMVAQAHMYSPPPPFNDNSISAELEDVVIRALEKDPKARFPSILDFAQALQDAIQQRPLFAPPQGPNLGIPQNPMGGAIWGQLQPQNSFTPPSPRGVHSDPTISAGPQASQLYQQSSHPFGMDSNTHNKRNTRKARRRPPLFDWASLQETNNKLFLWIGCIYDLLCGIPVFLLSHDPNLTLGLPLVAIILRFLCAAAIKPRTALPLAWILVVYETLTFFGLLIYLGIVTFFVLGIIIAIVAWVLNDLAYARRK